MANTSKAQAKAEQLRISQIGDFKSRIGGVTELPSGAVVRLSNPGGLNSFLDSKVIPNSLMGIIQKALKTGQAPKPEEYFDNGEMDMEKIKELTQMMDNIVCRVVVEPKVLAVPKDEADRDTALLYVDEFPLDDKQFIFQWVTGGTRDLEEFRRKLESNVAAASAVAVAEGDPVGDAGADAR